MSEQPIAYPSGWAEEGAYHPEPLNLKGKDYVTVAERVAWFVHDQRQLIAAGLATTGYSLRTELVEHNPSEGFAHYAAIVRDVLGNEATMYGSCTRKSFTDYLEKAATKALGRALLLLGYGTAFLDELDEGEIDGERKPVDAPQPRQRPQQHQQPTPQRRPPAPAHGPAHSDAGRPTAAPDGEGKANPWLTVDGYDPLSDMELRAKVKRIGILNMADFETFLRDARGYRIYDRAAVNATLTIWEGRHADAQAKLAAAGAVEG